MNGNVVGAIISTLGGAVTTVGCLVWTTRRQTRKIETMTAQQTEQITAHVTDKVGGTP